MSASLNPPVLTEHDWIGVAAHNRVLAIGNRKENKYALVKVGRSRKADRDGSILLF